MCPKRCIRAVSDDEGFLRPIIDEKKCVGCGLCRITCPINNRTLERDHSNRAYLYQSNSKGNKKESASGGAFKDICQSFIGDCSNFAIFGVELDSACCARFAHVDSLEEVGRFSGSKYVQANIGETYSDVKKCLKEGKLVIFSGTPCQVDGLRNYLRQPYDSLLCIDLICHGVGSPRVFRRYVDFLEREYGSKIVDFRFTDKRGGWLHKRLVTRFANGKEYSRMAITLDDPYMTAFLSHVIMRPSCYLCRYTNLARVGDVTIGDAWGVEKRKPKHYYQEGVSLVIPSTDKGKITVQSCASYGRLDEVNLTDYVKDNPQLQRPIEPHPNRDHLMSLATSNEVPFKEFASQLQYRSPMRRWLSEIKAMLK